MQLKQAIWASYSPVRYLILAKGSAKVILYRIDIGMLHRKELDLLKLANPYLNTKTTA
jgi:hypothetical protein